MAKPQNSFRIGLIQTCAGRDVDANLDIVSDLVETAASDGAVYVQTPEVTTLVTADADELRAKTATADNNPAVERCARIAERAGVWLHIGSMPVRLADEDRFANRAFLFHPDGRIAATYDKVHMFDVDIGADDRYSESRRYRPGRRGVIADVAGARLGLTICYDVRFPHLYRDLTQAGAQVLTVPSAFTVPTGEAHWHTLLRARAIENQCFVLAAAQSGTHESGRRTYGHSLVVSPWGEVLADAGDLQNTVICTDIDLQEVEDARRRIPSLSHDRAYDIENLVTSGRPNDVPSS